VTGNAEPDTAIAPLSSVDRVTTTPPAISTVGQLRESGHPQKSLREELRGNLLAALREGRDPWPGLHGFSATVIPQLERALLAGPGCCARWWACWTSGLR
jgi:magnesium chelatase subunit I